MKTINDIINTLQKIKNNHGDLPVLLFGWDSDEGFYITDIAELTIASKGSTSDKISYQDNYKIEVKKYLQSNGYNGEYIELG